MRHGFTLVELAIVLVIIGLLVGGVLTGADLIKSAQINATVSDMQSYTAAAMTFRDKYGGIPGDLRNDKAAQAGLTVSATNPGTGGEGDGDGLLLNGDASSAECSGGISVQPGLGGENTLFWRQLSDAGLIAFKSVADGTCIDTTNFGTGSTAQTTLAPLIPQLRLRNNGFIQVNSLPAVTQLTNHTNYYTLNNFAAAGTLGGRLNQSPILTAREAQGIDTKLDDGFPATGIVTSCSGGHTGFAAPNCLTFTGGNSGSGNAPSTSNTMCFDNTTTAGVYAVSVDDNLRCGLRIRAGF
ncbi:MAG: prepilin-type N-terminal cleavage/methylation domain-containing protein [Alphaproteobacteria bacterium]